MGESGKAGSLELFCLCPECKKETVFPPGEYRYTTVVCPSCKRSLIPYECCVERQSNVESPGAPDSIAKLDSESAFAKDMLIRANTLPIDSDLRRRWLVLEIMFKAKTREYKSSEQERREEIRQQARELVDSLKKKWDFPDNVYDLYIDECLKEEKLLYLTEFIKVMPRLMDEHPEQAESILDYVLGKAIG